MKHVKLFVALFAMLALGVTNAWAEEVTFDWKGSATADGGTTDYVVEQSPVTLTFAKGTASNAPRTNKEGSVRMYAGTTLTISCASGNNITKVIFTPTGNTYNATKLKYGESALTSDEWTLSSPSNEVKLTASANARFTKIVVTYAQSSGGGETPEPEPEPDPEPEPEPEPTTTNWVATDIANISATDVVVVTMSKGNQTWALYSNNGTSSAPTAVVVTVANDGLTVEPVDALKWNISNTAGSLTIYPNGTTETWLYCTSTNNGVRVGTNSNKTFTIEGTYLKHTGTKRYVGIYKSSDWRCYTDTKGNIAGQTLKFYKYVAPTSGGEGEEPTIAAPTFSIEAGTYTEAQEVTLSAEEGTTIYYTLDGTTPNAESTAYNEPIVLDECGTTTIKAIAISGETTSSVASATYTIKLPLNNSQANPYTEAEAIEVYDGGCYDNQEVYVKGVVKTAQFYDSSNTYTITLEGGFQFYKFYEAAGEAEFTADYIVAGDTLVACGKLVKFNTTYELGAGCYLVERKPYSAPKVDISNTPETAYTVAEAIALIDDITSDLTKGVYVKGQISEVESFNDSYGSITYWIKDEKGNTFQCYSGLGLNSEQFASVDDLVVGSQVVVYGTLKKHNSTYELDKNNYIVSLTLPSYTVTITVNDTAFGSVQGLAAEGKYEHGAEATLTATPADGYEFTCWTSGKDTVSIENPYTFTVTANVALVANFKEVVVEPTTETVYFVNYKGWDNVNVYAWTTEINAEWPGVAATKEAEQIGGFDVYSYTAEAGAYATVIFNNGSGQQTADLVWTAGKYYVQNGWYTREEAEALLAGTGIPSVITYVLRGVGGDWTVGIALTVNPDNENEYVLLGQDIAEGDAVKVVTLTDGVATAYCGKVDEYSAAHNFDDAGNIVLAPGKYNFYFKVNEDLIYIAAVKPGPATALENIAVEGKAVKAIINGQLIIIKNGVQYNAQGQVIK